MNSKNKTVEKAELVLDALSYALEHKLDIKNKKDVKKVSEKVAEIKEYCDQGLLTESEARDRVTDILLMLSA